jgi:hypothetical protein
LGSGSDNTVTNFLATANDNQAGKTNYGFKSNLSAIGTNGAVATNYNFYAGGNAPSYFKGELLSANDPTNAPGQNQSDTGVRVKPEGTLIASRSASQGNANPSLYLRRANASANGNWRAIEMYAASATSATGFIKIDGSVARSIDSRLGATGVAMADGAVDIVKLLQPKVITQGGETFNSFLPADLAETFAAAVDGEAEATEAIGTLVDYDGTVLETEVTEPEELTYEEEVTETVTGPMGVLDKEVTRTVTRTRTWTATGTRPIYQGVDQTKLIPLLTKALQEVMQKNEDLEARIAALEGA